MPLDQYVLGNVIGKGTYGEVTLARHKKDKKQYVIKKIDLHNASAKERLFAQQEVEILSRLRHPNIVAYKESFQDNCGFLSIVMGYCEGGDLYTKLKKQAKTGAYLQERQIVEWFVQITMALQYIHDRHILHRDLKTQNIFLTKSKIIKLGDLGIARVLDNNTDMATTMIGTPYYMSPELFSNRPYNHKSDVWALGCCVYEMATLKHAFNAKDMNSLVYKILKGKVPPMPTHYSDDLNSIMMSMLSYDPAQRPNASKILRHPFIKKHIALFLEGTKARSKVKVEEPQAVSSNAPIRVSSRDGSNGLECSDPQGIATASNVEVCICETADERKQIDPVKNDENLESFNRQCEKGSHQVVGRPSQQMSYSNGAKSSDHGPSKSSSNARRILRERIQAKNKEKRERDRLSLDQIGAEDDDSHEVRDHKPAHIDGRTEYSAERKAEERVLSAGSVSSTSSQDDASDQPKRSQDKDADQPRRRELYGRPLPALPRHAAENGASSLPSDNLQILPRVDREQESKPVSVHQPQVSAGVPNIAARRKRRERLMERESQSSPRNVSSRSLQKVSSTPASSVSKESGVSLKKEKAKSRPLSADYADGSRSSASAGKMQADDGSGSSLEESEEATPLAGSKDNSRLGDQPSDFSDLIHTMQATLKRGQNSIDVLSREESVDASHENDDDVDAGITCLSPTAGRLNERIERLRRYCIRGIGAEALESAYQIIDSHEEHKVEPALVALIGRDKFQLYGAEIWQLKFCEEFR